MKMMLSFLTSLVFPNHCLLCEDLLRPEEQSVCQICLAAQPRCSFLERQRLERISSTVEAHFSAVLINCPSVSTLCHNLKYGGHPRTARHLGYHFLGPPSHLHTKTSSLSHARFKTAASAPGLQPKRRISPRVSQKVNRKWISCYGGAVARKARTPQESN